MENYQKCKVENCENSALRKNRGSNGYCKRHYQQIWKNGKISKRTRYDPNEIIDCGEYYEICLYNRKNEEIGRAKIDKEDLGKVKNYKWCISVGQDEIPYVITIKNKKTILLHQLIMGNPPIGCEVDHKYHDTLDNRKYNLRFVTDSQNQMNRKSKGYCWNKKNKKWMAYIKINGKKIYLGYFIDKQDAIRARKEAEKKYFGEFAYKDKK